MSTVTRPFKLLIELQENKGKEVYDEIVHENLSKINMLKKLKPRNYAGKAKNTIINNAFARKEELDSVDASNAECEFSKFAITIFVSVA